jgi:hypothetical protein
VIGLAVNFLLVIAFVWLIILTFILFYLYQREKKLNRALKEEKLANVLLENDQQLKKLEAEVQKIQLILKKLESLGKSSFRQVGLVRFNAFEDIGGELSFSLALIDDWGNGFLLTSIQSRQESRVYAKPLEGGESPFPLSEEEKEAVRRAWKRP